MTEERWLPVVGWEGWYEVSDQGRVKSLARIVMRSNGAPPLHVRERILKPGKDGGGYLQVGLWRDGQQTTRKVHALVLEAWVGPCPPGEECCHLLGNENNRLENILWDTRDANARDQVIAGTHHEASKTHCTQGHEFTPENTRIGKSDGGRHCRECSRIRSRQRRERRQLAEMSSGRTT